MPSYGTPVSAVSSSPNASGPMPPDMLHAPEESIAAVRFCAPISRAALPSVAFLSIFPMAPNTSAPTVKPRVWQAPRLEVA